MGDRPLLDEFNYFFMNLCVSRPVVCLKPLTWLAQGCLILCLGWVWNTQSAQAGIKSEVKQINLTITSTGIANFASMMQQASTLAADSIQQAFSIDPNLNQVTVKITGEHNGSEVPLLFATVSRLSWQGTPDVRAWSQSFSGSETLLVLQPPQRPIAVAVSRTWTQQLEDMPGFRDD